MVEKKLSSTSINFQKKKIKESQGGALIKEKKVEQKEVYPIEKKTLQQKKENVVINKEQPRVITELNEKPILQEVREKKEIQKRKKDVITEYHEQPFIQVEEQPIIKRVERQPLHKKFTETELIKEYGDKDAPLKEIEKIQKSSDMSGVKLSKEKPVIIEKEEESKLSEVQHQDRILHIVQPVIKEVHNQKIVEEYEKPVLKKYYNEPIVKRVLKEPIFITETYEEAKLDRERDLKGMNKEQVEKVEKLLDTSISKQYEGYTVYNAKEEKVNISNEPIKKKAEYKEKLQYVDEKGNKYKLDEKNVKFQ